MYTPSIRCKTDITDRKHGKSVTEFFSLLFNTNMRSIVPRSIASRFTF